MIDLVLLDWQNIVTFIRFLWNLPFDHVGSTQANRHIGFCDTPVLVEIPYRILLRYL